MSKSLSIVLRVLGVVLVLALAAGGAFRLGYTRGVADSPAIAEKLQSWQGQAGSAPAPYAYRGFGPMPHGGFYAPYLHHGFNPLGKLLGFLFFAFLFFGMMRMFFFRRMMHHYGGGHPGWGHRPPCAYQPDPQAPAQPAAPATEKPAGESK